MLHLARMHQQPSHAILGPACAVPGRLMPRCQQIQQSNDARYVHTCMLELTGIIRVSEVLNGWGAPVLLPEQALSLATPEATHLMKPVHWLALWSLT